MDDIISWLMSGDVSIQYMVHRYLLGTEKKMLLELQSRIATEGFGAKFLSCQNESGHWGQYYYQPKWTSTHYTLLDLKNLCVPESTKPCKDMVVKMFDECMNADGGLNLSKNEHPSDICVDGMILNYASYFCKEEPRIIKLIDHLLSVQKKDGGFTWNLNSETGDPHTTISVLEGFGQYRMSGSRHRLPEVEESTAGAVEFLLSNRLFMEDADKRFLKLSYPYRYRYDLLRVLDCFAGQRVPFDARMQAAID